MKNEIKKNLVAILFGGALVFVVSLANAQFTEPTGGAPTDNVDSPVTVLAPDQVKKSGLSVGTFLANGIAKFQQQAFFPGSLKGQNPLGTDDTLRIGGVDYVTSTTKYVDAAATGDVHSEKTLGSAELVTQKKSRLCADDEGHVVFCPQLAAPSPTLVNAGVSSQPVMGGTRDTNVSCSATLSLPAGPGGENVELRFVVDRDVNGSTRRYTYCNLNIPEGQTIADEYPGREYYDGVSVVEACINASTVPIDPNGAGMPQC